MMWGLQIHSSSHTAHKLAFSSCFVTIQLRSHTLSQDMLETGQLMLCREWCYYFTIIMLCREFNSLHSNSECLTVTTVLSLCFAENSIVKPDHTALLTANNITHSFHNMTCTMLLPTQASWMGYQKKNQSSLGLFLGEKENKLAYHLPGEVLNVFSDHLHWRQVSAWQPSWVAPQLVPTIRSAI